MAAARTPSNTTPYSAELQTFLITKFDPLLAIVRELNDRLQSSEKERFRLERRTQRLEHQVLALVDSVEKGKPLERIEENDEDNPQAIREMLRSEEALVAPWLFSCQIGTPTSALQVLLEFTPDTTEELDVKLWKREEDMWIMFLEELPDAFVLRKPDSLQLLDLRRAARRALLELCRGEALFILRNVPGKLEAASCPTAITLVAILAAALSEAWSRIEAAEPEALGRVALVLEGSDIGSRLRAGRKRFRIEPLN
ncbi:hypothetical protein BESB_052520 [Besnoitia besnoiti]|uniref:Apicomplexan specific coiled coil protein n=1 Tax=Besnoitia besnoiti TaxID=94643 RepID=A0A2A9MH64_BESBE|nr:hypothetical protein BESB_052520 [Besnoitia besnoiti]PFH35601.1 hypothetical protein BESB_052520 [Besnoitia besnoiti]